MPGTGATVPMFTKQGLSIVLSLLALSMWIGLQIWGRHWAAGVFLFALPAAILAVAGQRVLQKPGQGDVAAEMKALRAEVDTLTRQIAAVEAKLAAVDKARVEIAEPRTNAEGD